MTVLTIMHKTYVHYT